MKLVIGLTGSPLAGKETCAAKIEILLRRDGFSVSRHRFSDILRETLSLWGIPYGRENEQRMAIIMNAETGFKNGALSRAMKHRLHRDPNDVSILDGVRWLSDETMVREFPQEGIKSIIIYITASAETRYERLKLRNRAGEAMTARETFDKQEQAKTEVNIPDIGGRADIILKNEHTSAAEFEKDIERAYTEKIRPLL